MPEYPLSHYKARNTSLVSEYVRGLTPYGLACKFDLSERRVRQILKENAQILRYGVDGRYLVDLEKHYK